MPATDKQGQTPKYPSAAVVCDWYNEWEDHLAQLQLAGEPEECLEYFIARKACDWQREQAAQLVKAMSSSGWDADTIASAIRTGASNV